MTRDEFVEKMKKKLDAWNDEISDLEEKIDEAQDTVSANVEARLIGVKAKFKLIEGKLDEVKKTAEPAWEKLKGDTEKSFETFRGEINQALSRFKKGA
jgi:predicted  nucleic acid-binding Zn-ribbon protein